MRKHLLLVSLSCLFFVACSPSPEELAKKGGFQNVEEMQQFQSAGFQTKAEVDRAKSYSAYQFSVDTSGNVDNPCFQEKNYQVNCFGKKIWWTGEIIGFSQSDGVRIQLLEEGKKEVNGVKLNTIESKSLAAQGINKDMIGKIIEFVGTIDKKNFVNPDIENISFSKIKSENPDVVLARVKKNELAKQCNMNVTGSVKSFLIDSNAKMPEPLLLIAFYLAEMKRYGFDAKIDDSKSNFDVTIGVGEGSFKEMTLPACVVEVKLSLTNRSDAVRKSECFNVAYLYDKEFGMYRGITTFYCNEIEKKLPIWIQERDIKNFQLMQ